MSYTQQTPKRKRRPQTVPQLRVEVRPLLVEGRRRQRNRRLPHLFTWVVACALLVIAVATTALAVALSGRSGAIRQPTAELASTALGAKRIAKAHTVTNQVRALTRGVTRANARSHHQVAADAGHNLKTAATHTAATHTTATHAAATTHLAAATHTTATTHTAATHTSGTHTVSSDHTAASGHRATSGHTTAKTHKTVAGRAAAETHGPANTSVSTSTPPASVTSTPNVAITSTPSTSSTSSTSSVQDDVAPLSTDMTTSEMATAAAAATASFTPPAYLVSDYRSLSKRYGVAWQVLAALSYAQEGGYAKVLAGESASQVTAAARNSLAAAGHGANVNLISQAAASVGAPTQALLDDAAKLAAAGAGQSPAAALEAVTGSAATAEEVMTVAQRIGSLAPQSDTELTDAAGGPEATTASSSSKAYADVPTAAVTSQKAPTGQAAVELNAMMTEAHLLNHMQYVWGGGHDASAWLIESGFDCSGFVSEVLHSAGYLDSPDTTQTLPDSAGILSGPGKYVTIYDRTINTMNFGKPKTVTTKTTTTGAPTLAQQTEGVHMTDKGSGDDLSTSSSVSIRVSPAVMREIHAVEIKKANEADNTINDEHVIIDLDGQWWESGGDSQDGGAEQVHRITDISESYLKSFNLVLHPAGL